MKSVIKLTDSAWSRCRQLISENNTKALRLSLKSGGCNGFEYKFQPTNQPLDIGDELVRQDQIEIQVCASSVMYLLGTEIDWKRDIMGETFHFNNPNASSTCGCGTSFNVQE